MRYEGDINTAQLVEINMLNDNAPDSELSDTGSSPLESSNFFMLTRIWNTYETLVLERGTNHGVRHA